ncbi:MULTISPECIES: lytic transglycosylase [Sediminimonas]|uniref:Lytic transglycosylase n=1 Tax=Sediminimonas qiaohouensis TaxID=552061 RepID=A0A7C9LSU5_9RHOB|nr:MULTISPECIES: lytic transglycosylase [Sediminimonas]MDR9484314.1 lytic transglycosylase [Sediminimonas sp.]MTJ05336.1 lytic transglycosylase [Sediminimonas qiaohouensis]
MSRTLRAMVIILVLASCGGGDRSAPRNLDDACAIVKDRPVYGRAFKKAQSKWGVPVAVQMAFIHQESKFDARARTPLRYALGILPMGRQSSAYGYAQALDGTWRDYQRDQNRYGARRDRIFDATDFIGWYMNKTRERNSIPLSDARNQYLAYHEGHNGFSRGTYRRKSWLMRISGEVASRAMTYDAQLATCGRRWR